MPSEKQVRWSQLRVGLTVIFASVTLAVLIFVMTGTTGLFTKKLVIHAFVDTTPADYVFGAPVRLEGVDIGNVTGIRVGKDPQRKAAPVDISYEGHHQVRGRHEEGLRGIAQHGRSSG